jgi:hypothetical protein
VYGDSSTAIIGEPWQINKDGSMLGFTPSASLMCGHPQFAPAGTGAPARKSRKIKVPGAFDRKVVYEYNTIRSLLL